MRKVLSVELKNKVRPPTPGQGFGHAQDYFTWKDHQGKATEMPYVRVWELNSGDFLLMATDGHQVVLPRSNVAWYEPVEQLTAEEWAAAEKSGPAKK